MTAANSAAHRRSSGSWRYHHSLRSRIVCPPLQQPSNPADSPRRRDTCTAPGTRTYGPLAWPGLTSGRSIEGTGSGKKARTWLVRHPAASDPPCRPQWFACVGRKKGREGMSSAGRRCSTACTSQPVGAASRMAELPSGHEAETCWGRHGRGIRTRPSGPLSPEPYQAPIHRTQHFHRRLAQRPDRRWKKKKKKIK